MITPYMRMKALKAELKYAQMWVRLDARNLKAAINKVKQIGELMRAIQAGGKQSEEGKDD